MGRHMTNFSLKKKKRGGIPLKKKGEWATLQSQNSKNNTHKNGKEGKRGESRIELIEEKEGEEGDFIVSDDLFLTMLGGKNWRSYLSLQEGKEKEKNQQGHKGEKGGVIGENLSYHWLHMLQKGKNKKGKGHYFPLEFPGEKRKTW